MVHRRSNIDWYKVFLDAFSHDGAVDGGSDSPAPAPQAPATEPRNEYERGFGPGAPQVDGDDGPHFRLNRAPPAKAAGGGLGPDVDVPEGVDDFSLVDEDEQGGHVSVEQCSKSSPKFSGQKENDGQADVSLGPDIPSASNGLYDFSPVDEDAQEERVIPEHCLKLSPKSYGKKNKDGKLPLNKRKSQGNGGKRKPSVNKMRVHATDSEESDYEISPPSSFSKRRNQRLQNSSSIHSRKKANVGYSDNKRADYLSMDPTRNRRTKHMEIDFHLVQDVVVLDDDNVEPKEEVNREMSDKLNEQKIYYPSRDDHEAVMLTRSDIKCLDPEVFLSSEVINFYIKYIQRTTLCNENFRDKFYIFNTFFFGKLEKALCQPRDFRKLRRWWKGANIFNNAYIILPIHAEEHWSLVIICIPPKERISEPIILHLDSLGMHRSDNIFNTVGRYIEMEWRFLSIAEPAWSCLLSDIHKETVQVPQQNNAYDCGVFMLFYIEQFIKEAPASLIAVGSNFKPEEASSLRQRIRELLLEQFERAARIDGAISKATDVPRDAANSVKGIRIAESNGAFRDTSRINKHIKVTESGYPDNSKEHIADVAVQNKGTSNNSNKCNKRNTDCGNEEVTGNRPVPDAVFEIPGTCQVWIKRIYRPPITLPLDDWYRSRGGSRRDDRKAFIEQFRRKE